MVTTEDYRRAWESKAPRLRIPGLLLAAMELAGVSPPTNSDVSEVQVVEGVWTALVDSTGGNIALGAAADFAPVDIASLSSPFNLDQPNNGGAAIIMRAALSLDVPPLQVGSANLALARYAALQSIRKTLSIRYQAATSNATKYAHAQRLWSQDRELPDLSIGVAAGEPTEVEALFGLPTLQAVQHSAFADLESVFWRAGNSNKIGVSFGRSFPGTPGNTNSVEGLGQENLIVTMYTQQINMTREVADQVVKLLNRSCTGDTPVNARAQRIVVEAGSPARRMPATGR